MNYKLAIFDLDGTLVDSLEAIAQSANHACKELGLKTYPLSLAKTLIGHGIKGIADKVAENEKMEDQKDKIMQTVRKYYDIYWNYHLRLYPNIDKMLDKLTEKNIKLAINTNKDQKYTDETVDMLLKKWTFTHIIGASSQRPRKPDPANLLEIVEHNKIALSEAIYFGDMDVDIQTGKNANIFTVFCDWGIGNISEPSHEPDLIIRDPMDIFDVL